MGSSWSSAVFCACRRTRFVIGEGSVNLLLRKLWPVRDPRRQHFNDTDACVASALE